MKKKLTLLSIATLALTCCIKRSTAQSNFVSGIIPGSTNPTAAPSQTTAICDTIFSFPSQDPWPSGIVSDGTFIYSMGVDYPYIYKHNFNGALINSISKPGGSINSGGDIDFDGTNLLVLIEQTDMFYKINPATGAIISQFSIPQCNNNCYGLAFDGSAIWITNYTANLIYKIDTVSGSILKTIGISPPSYLLPIKFINGQLYGISLFPGMLHQIDTTNGNFLSTNPWCLVYPTGFCVANNQFWGVSSSSSLSGKQRIYQFDSLLSAINPPNFSLHNQLQVSPNPFRDNLTISLNNPVTNNLITLSLYNIMGKEVLSQPLTTSNLKLQTSNLSNGVYFLKAGEQIKKVIKM